MHVMYISVKNTCLCNYRSRHGGIMAWKRFKQNWFFFKQSKSAITPRKVPVMRCCLNKLMNGHVGYRCFETPWRSYITLPKFPLGSYVTHKAYVKSNGHYVGIRGADGFVRTYNIIVCWSTFGNLIQNDSGSVRLTIRNTTYFVVFDCFTS